MAPKTTATDLDDQTDADEGMGEFEEDGTAEILRKLMSDDGPDNDDGGFDQPFAEGDAPDRDVVSAEKGTEMVEDAQLDRERRIAAEKKGKTEKAAGEDDAAPPADGDKPADKPADAAADKGKAEEAAPDFTKASIADLVKDVPEGPRAELTKRLGEFEKVNALFAGREEEMRIHGLSGPSDVISRLLHLNAYAQQNPGEYIAWVASETGAGKAHEVLAAAAQKLGLKVVQDTAEGDDDPFMTDRERELFDEVRRLKAQTAQPPQNFGPMAPQEVARMQAMQVITGLRTELDGNGHAKRPYWGNVEHLITQRATAHVAQSGRPATRDDLARFYDEAVAELTRAFGGGANSAAQPPAGVAQTQARTAAPSTQKSMAASKMIDGAGQGATRQPALRDDAPIEDVIRHLLAQQQ